MQNNSKGKRDHKAAAKALKRRRIEESGGTRPPVINKAECGTAASKPAPPRNRTSHLSVQKHPRFSTLSIAVPVSLVYNVPTKELQTQLIGQIARAATIYQVDEIIVYDDKAICSNTQEKSAGTNSCISHLTFVAKILEYCECPKYLKKHFFPLQPDLRHVGLLHPLEAPHHMKEDDHAEFREAVVVEDKSRHKSNTTTSFVDCGVRGPPIPIDQRLAPGIRCTVQIHPSLYNNKSHSKHATPIKHHVVSPSTPRETNGTYWGYTVRIAESIQSTWKECPFEDTKYRTIGTTFQGMAYHHLDDFTTLLHHGRDVQPGDNSSTPPLNHYLIVFGGMGGIEETVEADESVPVNRNECHKLFDLWVNTFPWFGTKSVRIEEAVWISLARLRPLLFPSSHTTLATTNDVKERKGNNQESHHSTRIMTESITSESEISDESSV